MSQNSNAAQFFALHCKNPFKHIQMKQTAATCKSVIKCRRKIHQNFTFGHGWSVDGAKKTGLQNILIFN